MHKNYLSRIKFHVFVLFSHFSSYFDNFLVDFGEFLKFWEIQEIQDDGSKMAAMLKS